jgi:hypothetical protein
MAEDAAESGAPKGAPNYFPGYRKKSEMRFPWQHSHIQDDQKMMTRNETSKLLIAINLLGLITIAGCGGQLYKVAPLPASRPPEISTSNAQGLNIGAEVLGGDSSVEQFDANLPLAGVIAIDVKLINQSSESINAKRLKVEVRSDEPLKQILPKKALSKVIDFYENNFYRLDARKRTQESYDAVALNLNGSIAPGEVRRGFLFFEAANKDLTGLTLTVTDRGVPISVSLGEKPRTKGK